MSKTAGATIPVLLIALLAVTACLTGILSRGGPGPFQYRSIRGETVPIYGTGLYRHMSADVAIQGIAQDWVTLFLGIPLLLAGLRGSLRSSMRHRFLLAGSLGYFFVTYLFYTAMGMYNTMYIVYVVLLGLSFITLLKILLSFDLSSIAGGFTESAPTKLTGWFLIVSSLAVGLMWLGTVIPPLLDGRIYPPSLQHYTTLIVQGFDLGLLLPLAFISGMKLKRRTPLGYLGGTVYIVFLSLMMTALSAKIAAMALNGVNVIPAVVIIPAFNAGAVVCGFLMLGKALKYRAG